MNISIMMSIGCQNLGDELILKNEIKQLQEKYGKYTKFKVFTYDIKNIFYKNENIEYLEYFPIGIKKPKNLWRNTKNFFVFFKTVIWSDKIIIGGGGIMFDNEIGNYSNPLNQWLFRTRIVSFFKKDLIFWGISIDIMNKNNLKKITKIFLNAKKIFIRDNHSFEILQSLNIKSKISHNLNINSEVIRDPVFYDNGKIGLENYKKNFLVKKIEAKNFCLDDIKNLDLNGKIIGLALRRGYLKDEKKLIKEIINFILRNGGKIILIPHSFHKIDKKANDYLFLKKFIKIKTSNYKIGDSQNISITKNMQESYLVYKKKKIDFCLSMRLHSMILSQVYGIRFLGIKYSKKGDLM